MLVMRIVCAILVLLSTATTILGAGQALGPANATELASSESTANETLGTGNIEGKIEARQEKLREIKAALRPLQNGLNALAGQYPTFQVTGEILDRGEDWASIFGTAFPSNGDQGHLGTVIRKGNLQIADVDHFQNSVYYTHTRVYFIEKTIGQNALGGPVPVRIFSTRAPRENREAEQKMSKLRTQMEPLSAKIRPLEVEIEALAEEKQLKEQHAVAKHQRKTEALQREGLQAEWDTATDSVPNLEAYAVDKWASGDHQAAERACGQAEELGSTNSEFLFFCAELSEKVGDPGKAFSRYQELLKYEPEHPAANRRVAYIQSNQQSDPFEEGRYLSSYLQYAGGSEPEYGEVESRLADLRGEWGSEARHIRLAIDEARTNLPGWILMERYTHRTTVADRIQRNEGTISNGNSRLDQLRSQLADVGLDLDEIFRDSKDDRGYWDSRRKQAADLRSRIKREEKYVKTAYRQGEAQYRRENARTFKVILREIEAEARSAGVALE